MNVVCGSYKMRTEDGTCKDLPTYPPTYLLTYLPTHLPTYPPTYLPNVGAERNSVAATRTYLSTHLPTYLPTYSPNYLPTYLPNVCAERNSVAATFYTSTREVPVSNTCHNTGYTDREILWSFSVTPANSRIVPWQDHDRSLPNSFQFIIRPIISHDTLRSPQYWQRCRINHTKKKNYY
jgi:hypothetical protein